MADLLKRLAALFRRPRCIPNAERLVRSRALFL